MTLAQVGVVDGYVLQQLIQHGGLNSELLPPLGCPGAFFVTYPEYVSTLIKCADRPPTPFMRMVDSVGGVHGIHHWLDVFFDLISLQELHGLQVELVIPRPRVAASVVAVMRRYELDVREATNLLVTEVEQAVFIADRTNLSSAFLAAVRDRNIDCVFSS